MIIYLDGLGRCGKTILAERLCADLPGYRRVHFSVPDVPDAFDYFWGKVQELESCENLVLDRFHWANHAYGSVFGGSVLTDLDWWRLDQWLALQKAVAILMVDGPKAIHQRMVETAAQDPEKRVLASASEIGEVQNRFNRCFDRSVISPRWSMGLDQFFNLATMEAREPYEKLLAYVRNGGKEVTE